MVVRAAFTSFKTNANAAGYVLRGEISVVCKLVQGCDVRPLGRTETRDAGTYILARVWHGSAQLGGPT